MTASPETLLHYLRRLVLPSGLDEATDAALLGRFVSQRDERAFAALAERHGPLVLHVCRRVLGNVHDAEDAFQATFLVLARKAATVQPREALTAWLHGVARRVALKTRIAKTRRFRDARPLVEPPIDRRPDPLEEVSALELLYIIDEEIQRLAEVYRLPLILCCLEGHSLEETARRLGWTQGSVKGRLERGRAQLHSRLVRRGLTLSAALAAVEAARSASEAALLADRTVRGAVAFGMGQPSALQGVSSAAVALAGEVVKDMARVRFFAAFGLATCVLAAGLILSQAVPFPSTELPDEPGVPLAAPDEYARATLVALAENRHMSPADEANEPIEVSGRVLDPEGRPVAGAKVFVGYGSYGWPFHYQIRQPEFQPKATSGADGRFQFKFTQAELDAKYLDDSRPAVIAVAAGFGPDWEEIKAGRPGKELRLNLVQDQPVNGRIVDENRRPVVGAKVTLIDVMSDPLEGVEPFLRQGFNSWFPKVWKGSVPDLPPEVITDADGQFRLTGLGRDRLVRFTMEGPGLWPRTLAAVTLLPGADRNLGTTLGAAFEHVAPPSRPIRGVVRDRTTGRPLEGAKVKLSTQGYLLTRLTDKEGAYELPGHRAEVVVVAQPPAGQPYFATSARVAAGKNLDPVTTDLDLVSGIRLQGRITDRGSSKPPRAAVVNYFPLFGNPHGDRVANEVGTAASSALAQLDGSFSLVVQPGPGVVCVAASPCHSYAEPWVDGAELADLFRDGQDHGDNDTLFTAGPGGRKSQSCCVHRYHALAFINPAEGTDRLTLDLSVQSVRPLVGLVIGPDGRPLTGVKAVGLTAMGEEEALDGASFAVASLSPKHGRRLFFHHPELKLARVVTLRGDETEPLLVQLGPSGSVVGRVVDGGGNPRAGVRFSLDASGRGPSVAVSTDQEGRFRAALVPGEKYSLKSPIRNRQDSPIEVQVEPGQTKILGILTLSP